MEFVQIQGLFKFFQRQQVPNLVAEWDCFKPPTVGWRRNVDGGTLADKLCFRQVNLLHQRPRIYRPNLNVPSREKGGGGGGGGGGGRWRKQTIEGRRETAVVAVSNEQHRAKQRESKRAQEGGEGGRVCTCNNIVVVMDLFSFL